MVSPTLGYIIIILDATVDPMGKIGITCRQPFLGADEWIKEELEKIDAPDKEEEKIVEKGK